MSKKSTSGHRHAYIDDEVDENNKNATPCIEEQLVASLAERYTPAETIAESTEQKTTLELCDEMEATADVHKSLVHQAMVDRGFKLHYTGVDYVWLLKER